MMGLWIMPAIALAFAGGGVILGRLCWRLPRVVWLAVYLLLLAIITLMGASRWIQCLQLAEPISWIIAGQNRFFTLAMICPILLVAPMHQLSGRRLRIILVAFMVLFTTHFGIMPFVHPILARHDIARIRTFVNRSGVCLQSTEYTCGPAAAVTALHALNLAADEADLATLAGTAPATGTDADLLCQAIDRRFAQFGVTCDYLMFDRIDDLAGQGPVIVPVRLSLFLDHYITVLAVDATRDRVIVADPLTGLKIETRARLESIWKSVGIVLRRPGFPLRPTTTSTSSPTTTTIPTMLSSPPTTTSSPTTASSPTH